VGAASTSTPATTSMATGSFTFQSDYTYSGVETFTEGFSKLAGMQGGASGARSSHPD
jgi:hypothetical protein